MLIWNLVLENIAPLNEIQTLWSYEDIIKAHSILQMKTDLLNIHRKANSNGYSQRAAS